MEEKLLDICERESIYIPDINQVQKLIESGVNIEVECRRHERSPLVHACRSGNLEIVKLLLNAGADIEHKDKYEFNSLFWSLSSAKIKGFEIAKELIFKGANINSADSIGNTPLMFFATTSNHPDLVSRFLLENGADPEVKNFRGQNFYDVVESIENIEVREKLKRILSEFQTNVKPAKSD